MNTAVKTKFPRAKICRAVSAILPRGQSFSLQIEESEIGKKKIVRVVTSAWKRLRGWERIGKVLDAVDGILTPQEQKGIFRFSVLTPEEYKILVLDESYLGAPIRRTSRVKTAGAKKLAAKRSAGRRSKRAPAK